MWDKTQQGVAVSHGYKTMAMAVEDAGPTRDMGPVYSSLRAYPAPISSMWMLGLALWVGGLSSGGGILRLDHETGEDIGSYSSVVLESMFHERALASAFYITFHTAAD